MPTSDGISIIVPVLDEAANLPRALANLRRLRGSIELIVVDGGSTDGSAEIARQCGAHRVVSAPRGRGHQLRAGAHAARGPILWFVHVDSVLPADAAQHVQETIDRGFDGGAFRVRHRASGHAGRYARWWLRLADVRARGGRAPYGDQALFLTRGAYERAGGMPQLPLMEDIELARRLRRSGCRLRRLNVSVEVSGRRFEAAPIRTMLCWSAFPALYACGVRAETLSRWYGTGRRTAATR